MARPRRCGLDWFPLDTELDDKMKFIEATHGIKGYAIVIKLLQKIYGHFGYFGEWNARTATLFANELRLPLKVVTDVVGTCVEEGIFDATMLEKHGILTSAGIQRRYLAAARKRTDLSIKAEYALAEPALIYQSAPKTPVSAPKTPVSAVESTQSKSKYINKNNISAPSAEEVLAELEGYAISDADKPLLVERFLAYNEAKGWQGVERWQAYLRLFVANVKMARQSQTIQASTSTRAKKRATSDASHPLSFDIDEFMNDALCASYGAKEVPC